MSRLFLCLLLLHIFSLAVAFKVVKFSQVPDRQDLTVGERLILLCKSNNAWERCNFVHRPAGGSKGDQYCKQEWKRSSVSGSLTLPSPSPCTHSPLTLHALFSSPLIHMWSFPITSMLNR